MSDEIHRILGRIEGTIVGLSAKLDDAITYNRARFAELEDRTGERVEVVDRRLTRIEAHANRAAGYVAAVATVASVVAAVVVAWVTRQFKGGA